MITIEHKRGDVFSWEIAVENEDGTPIDITMWQIKAELRDKDGDLISVIDTSITDGPKGLYKLYRQSDTDRWPVFPASDMPYPARLDVQYTNDIGEKVSTVTICVNIVEDITQG